MAWAFIASYYFVWRGDEIAEPSYIDESGWVPDGAYTQIIQTEESPSAEE